MDLTCNMVYLEDEKAVVEGVTSEQLLFGL